MGVIPCCTHLLHLSAQMAALKSLAKGWAAHPCLGVQQTKLFTALRTDQLCARFFSLRLLEPLRLSRCGCRDSDGNAKDLSAVSGRSLTSEGRRQD